MGTRCCELSAPQIASLRARPSRARVWFRDYKIACLAQWLLQLLLATSTAHCSRKRKRVVLTLEKKLSILHRLKSGETQGKVAIEYGVGRSTIGDIKKTQDKLKSFASTMENFAMSLKGRKVMRMADDAKLDEAVYLYNIL